MSRTEAFAWCALGHRHWGTAGGAGLLVISKPRMLLQLRPSGVQHPGTWSTPGGALEAGESPLQGALREAVEEMGPLPRGLRYVDTLTEDCGGWKYHTVVMHSPAEFAVARPGGEHGGARWFTADDLDGIPLHPGFARLWARGARVGTT